MSPYERILAATRSLFYRQGIQATGVGELAEVAGVSKRTLYQLFDSKDELIRQYLQRLSDDGIPSERSLDRDDLAPRAKLLALFDRPPLSIPFRGCPFHNASVELADPQHPARAVVVAHKRKTLDKVIELARAIGAKDPEMVARQLLTLLEGARSLAVSLDDSEPFDSARSAAAALIDLATD
jgi:AcrR family transcriptional regulator